jgi:hypothetical protein
MNTTEALSDEIVRVSRIVLQRKAELGYIEYYVESAIDALTDDDEPRMLELLQKLKEY